MLSELKNWKKLLKTFPDKSSSNKDAKEIKIKEAIKVELEEIKSKIETTEKENNFDDGFKLLASLLKELREKKNLKLLTICRQVKNIHIENKKVTLFADEEVLDEISFNTGYQNLLQEFFGKYDLSLNIKNETIKVSVANELRIWLGDKLEIK